MRSDSRAHRALIAFGALSLVAGTTILIGSPSGAAPAARPASTQPKVAVAHSTDSSKTTYKVTIVARSCNAFDDIMANRARNNIQESLQDLGPDTSYSSGQPVTPAVEESLSTQVTNCHPLVGWNFDLGKGITGRTQANDWLSTVTSPYAQTIKTAASTPLLDSNGNSTGKTIDGATTITLTSEQAQRAQSGSSLWIQGGLVNDPLLDGPSTPKFNPPQAFGALRCAVDNLNGDNVEWIAYPTGASHVFCYYYTVSPPPKAAKIIVKKVVTGEPNNTETFAFAGNVSYIPATNSNPDDSPFSVQAGTSGTEFIRAANTTDPWNFRELPADGYILQSINCTKNLTSAVTVPSVLSDPVTVTLVPNDVVTCTFTNIRNIAGLSIQKKTSAGTGTFKFTASSPSGSNTVTNNVTTLAPGVPAQAVDITAGSGDFTSREDLPAGADPNSWSLTSVNCNGSAITPVPAIGQDLVHSIPPGSTFQCTYINTPNGHIIIRKTTVGGVGNFGFAIVPLGDFGLDGPDGAVWLKATTAAAGTPTTAGDLAGTSNHLPYQRYAVIEAAKPNTGEGDWVLTSASCDAAGSTPIDSPELLGAQFDLADSAPTVTCDFTNTLYKPASLVVRKLLAGDTSARTGAVSITTRCNDGLVNTLTGPAGHPGPFTSDTMKFTDFMVDSAGNSTLRCQIRETATGVGADAKVATRWRVRIGNNVIAQGSGRTARVPVNPAKAYIVEFQNRYSAAAPSPTPTPTSTGGTGDPGTGGGGSGGGTGDLPHTGGSPWSWVLLFVGLAAIATGASLRRRGRHAA